MRRIIIYLLAAWVSSSVCAETTPPTFTPAELPARGTQQVTFTVPTSGVHALWSESGQGVGLRIIDRMTGPSELSGVPGKQDGRFNRLLDAGEYRVQTQASEQGEGTVKLLQRAYQELHPQPLRLTEFQAITAQLGDFEQRSYAFTLSEARQVNLRVGGRALDSVRLWQDGRWLVNAVSHREQIEATPGQPYTLIQLSAALTPGYYQLTVYGNTPLPWTQAAEQSPLHLEWGIPTLPARYRGFHRLNALGVASYLVPATSRYFRLELAKPGTAQLRLSAYRADQPYTQAQVQRTLKPTAPLPRLELDLDQPDTGSTDASEESEEPEESDASEGVDSDAAASDGAMDVPEAAQDFDFQTAPASGYYLLQVQGNAGQEYTLQQLPRVQNPYPIQGVGDYWLGLTYTGAASDLLSAHAILTTTDTQGRATLMQQQTVTLDDNRTWRGSFNLDGEFSLLLQVTQANDYTFEASGAGETRLRIVPFFADAGTTPPAYRPAGGKWKLAPGFYWLQGEAVTQGLLELTLKPVNAPKKSRSQALNSLAAVGFPVRLAANQSYKLWLNSQPGIRAGLDLRALPLDLAQPLPLAQAPGEYTAPAIAVAEPGILEAIADNGQYLELSFAATARWKTQLALKPGSDAQVKIRHTGETPIAYLLRFTPQRLLAEPKVSSEAIPPATPLPILTLQQTLAAQLPVQGSQLYQLPINKAGIYQLESQGLLALNGALRTRLFPALQQASQNGSGRNFSLYDYLNPGDYQLGVQAEGEAYGHYALRAAAMPLRDGGILRPDQQPLSASLAAGEGWQLRFKVETPGLHRLEVLGLNQRRFRLRLEDAEGWPVVRPLISDLIETLLTSGEYRLIVLPEALPARLTARLTAVLPRVALKGHGPHPLSWDTALEHVWQEPEEGAPREPDRWQFNLPALLDVSLSLAAEMRGELVRLDAGANFTPVATLAEAKVWEGTLARGAYELRVQALRQNNRLPYRVELSAKQLAAGQTRSLTLPADLNLRVAGDELLELATWGKSDTRLRLYDTQNRLIAEQDDSPLGWNVQLTEALPAGEYRLRLEAVAPNDSDTDSDDAATTQLSARAWPVTTVNPLKAGERRQLRLTQAYRIPLILGGTPAFVALAQASVPLGLALAQETPNAPWLTRQTGAAVNLAWLAQQPAKYQLWLWPVGGATEANVEWHTLPEQLITADELRQGLAAKSKGRQLYRLPLGQGATVQAPAAPASLLASGGAEQAFRPLHETHFAPGGQLWLLPGAQATGPLELQRLSLPANTDELPLTLPAQGATVLDAGGAPEGIRVAVVSASRGLPLVGWVNAADPLPLPGLSGHTSASVSFDATSTQLKLWRGDDAAFPLQTTLRQYRYPLPAAPQPLTLGQHDLALNAHQALRYHLPNGSVHLTLTLPAQTVAVTSLDGIVRSTHYSGTQTQIETLDTEADTLWLIPLETPASSATVGLTPSSPNVLSSGSVLHRSFTQPGIWQLELRLPAAEQRAGLHLLSLGGTVDYLTINHKLHDLTQALPTSGIIRLHHLAGNVALWLAGASESLDPWLNSPMTRLNLNAARSVTLDGAAQTLRLEVSEPRLVHLRATMPLLVALRAPGNPVEARAFPNGLAWDMSLPQGVSLISLRPLHGESLSGSVHLDSQAAPHLTEGLGTAVLLPPGGNALFHLELPQAGPLGVGVNADPDQIDTRLFSADGTVLGTGVTQWHTLPAGSYWLELRAPETARLPILARPAVVGLQPSAKLPPTDVLRGYLDLTRTAP